VTRTNGARRRASINTTYAQMRRQIETLDELREGAMAGSACGDHGKARARLLHGSPIVTRLFEDWHDLLRRVTLEETVSAWR
jgi:hypothetical protein